MYDRAISSISHSSLEGVPPPLGVRFSDGHQTGEPVHLGLPESRIRPTKTALAAFVPIARAHLPAQAVKRSKGLAAPDHCRHTNESEP